MRAFPFLLLALTGVLANCGTLPTAAQAWGDAGRIAYARAADAMAAQNAPPQPLDDAQRAALQPFFGSLVDRVQVSWGAHLLSGWSSSGFDISPGNWAGQTYGDRIYMSDAYQPGDAAELTVLAHEMVHAWQAEQLGGVGAFGYEYFKNYYEAGQSYTGNPYEAQAYAFEDGFARGQATAPRGLPGAP